MNTGYQQALRQQAKAAAAARQARLMREVMTDARRLAAADTTRSEGDAAVAVQIYVRLALSASHPGIQGAARQRLDDMGTEFREKVIEVNEQLTQDLEALSTAGETLSPSESDGELPPLDPSYQLIIDAFAAYEELGEQYDELPGTGQEFRNWLARERAKPGYAAALNEEEARYWWLAGQELEEKDELCCAFHMYERGARLLPAPSAEAASERLERMKEDPELVQAAELCAEMQWCHRMYERAERIADIRPDMARELYVTITRRAPDDTPIYAAAQEAIDALAQR